MAPVIHVIVVIVYLSLSSFTTLTSGGQREYIWYNFRTQQIDIQAQAPSTDAEAVQYIWQDAEAQELYRVYRDMGCSVLDAMANVLKVQAGIEETTTCVQETH